MVFGKISGIASAAATRLSVPKSSSSLYVPPGSSPPPGFRNGFGTSRKKNLLRPSTSLQDFSAYRQLDPEEGDIHPERPLNLRRENDGSSFSKEKTSLGSAEGKKWKRVIVVLLCLILVAFLVYALTTLYFNWSQRASRFYVVLDCGSTGTRVYLYQISVNRKKDDSLPILLKSLPEGFRREPGSQSGRAYNRMETVPGFDKLVHNISGLREAIKPLVWWAKKQIPRNAHKSTSLFLYATAGLRRLPTADSEWLLSSAWSIVKDSPFLCKREWVKIISGTEEAYYGWIALNYQAGTLWAIPDKRTLGALDLGGSSLQVTFESEPDTQDETSLQMKIGSVNHHLSAYSLSGYGLNDAFDKSVVRLVKGLPQINKTDLLSGKTEIGHPCLQSGYREKYICSHCASALQDGGIATTTEVKESGKLAIELVGAPKWEECKALAKVAVNLSEWSDQSPGIDCQLQPCALSKNVPRPYGQFYAMSGFFVVYRFFNLTPDAALDDVIEKGREFCEKNWIDAKSSVSPQPFIEQYCFRAPYVVFLLRDGLHITDTDVTIASGGITWTLGVALWEADRGVSTRMVFRSYEILRVKFNPVIVFGSLFMSLFFLLCASYCVSNSMPKYFRRQYLPLFKQSSASSASVLNIPTNFRFRRWSSTNLGEKVKTPLSPTNDNNQQNPFDSGGIQLKTTMFRTSSSVAHSYSSDSLGQMQFENSTLGSFWTPHGRQMLLQSRRSASRDDLTLSQVESPLV